MAARRLGLVLHPVSFRPGQGPAALEGAPAGDVLLSAGSFEDDVAIAGLGRQRRWRAMGLVAAGVEELQQAIGERVEGLYGPCQWFGRRRCRTRRRARRRLVRPTLPRRDRARTRRTRPRRRSPPGSSGSVAATTPKPAILCGCWPRHGAWIPPPCSAGSVSIRSPACKPAIRSVSFSGNTEGASWSNRFLGRPDLPTRLRARLVRASGDRYTLSQVPMSATDKPHHQVFGQGA